MPRSVASDVFRIEIPVPFKLGHANGYLIIGRDRLEGDRGGIRRRPGSHRGVDSLLRKPCALGISRLRGGASAIRGRGLNDVSVHLRGQRMPIAYIRRTRERYAHYPPYHWVINTDAPWTPLPKPLKDCRLALISSGGFYLKDHPPFKDNDASYRLIPKDAHSEDLRIHHHAYRDDDPDRDPNCVFPLERLRELEATGVIGELAGYAVSCVTLYSPRRELEERAPKIIAELQAMRVDAAFLVPV